MLDFIDPDPVQAIIKIALTAGLAVLAVGLWRSLGHRSRRFGGTTLAAAVMGLAVVAMLVSIAPDVLPPEIAIMVLVLSLVAVLRPEQVVRATGGPSLRYRALREGRELQLLVRERGGWSVAGRNEEVAERVAGLGAFEGQGTERYIGLVRETLFLDPGAAGSAEKLEALAEADAELRASLGARPMFERELELRAAALDGEPTAEG